MRGYKAEKDKEILCSLCSIPLEPTKVKIRYLKSSFPAELPGCPNCGQIYVPEDLALGKMLEVEKTLEDK